jgi:hypothetical protein
MESGSSAVPIDVFVDGYGRFALRKVAVGIASVIQ